MHRLILVRHGESEWNLKNLFTGWTDVDLTEKGHEQARETGRKLKAAGILPDQAYTSVLKRAIHTLDDILDETDCVYILVIKNWKLNERHYGALQGLNKKETAQKYGEEQVHEWRRSYWGRPPALSKDDPRNPARQRMYRLCQEPLPLCESLQDTIERVIPFYEEELIPHLADQQTVIVSAHGNTLRALVKFLDELSPETISQLEIPNGNPLIYELDEAMQVQNRFYLDDPERTKALDELIQADHRQMEADQKDSAL